MVKARTSILMGFAVLAPSMVLADDCSKLIPDSNVDQVEVIVRYSFSDTCDLENTEYVRSSPSGFESWAECQLMASFGTLPDGDSRSVPGRAENWDEFNGWLANYRSQYPMRHYAKRSDVFDGDDAYELICYFTADWAFSGAEVREDFMDPSSAKQFDDLSSIPLQERKFGFTRY